jgi:hypothetical protein
MTDTELAVPDSQMSLDQYIDDAWGDSRNSVIAARFNEVDLEKEKLRLRGVPFVITKVTYHSDFAKSERGYVTVEGRIAPRERLEEEIHAGRIPDVESVSELLYKPGETIKFNDGSTGVRRQLTMVLHNLGIITVAKDITKNDQFDAGYPQWESFTEFEYENGDKNKKTGEVEKIPVPVATKNPRTGKPLLIVCEHGLRVSHLEDWDTDVFYLA